MPYTVPVWLRLPIAPVLDVEVERDLIEICARRRKHAALSTPQQEARVKVYLR